MKRIRLLGIIVVIAIVGYAAFMVYEKLTRAQDLNTQLNQEKEELQGYTQEIENRAAELQMSLQEKDKTLKGLAHVEAIRQSVTNAQATIDQLSRELATVNKERITLQESNSSMVNRLQNTTKEFIRVTEELKNIKSQLLHADKNQILPLREKIEKLSLSSQGKDEELAQAKKELKELQGERQINKLLEKKVKDLETEKSSLLSKISEFQQTVSRQSGPLKSLEENISQLNAELAQKRSQISSLQAEFTQLNSAKFTQEKQARQYQDSITSLETANRNLKSQLAMLSDELSKKRQELDAQKTESARLKNDVADLKARLGTVDEELSGSKQSVRRVRDWESGRSVSEDSLRQAQDEISSQDTLIAKLNAEKERLSASLERLRVNKSGNPAVSAEIENTSGQVRQLADIMIRKELELDKVKTELSLSKDKMLSLQNKVGELENNQKASLDNKEKVRDLETQKLSLQAQLNDAQSALVKKEEISTSLQKNLDYLSQQILRKEEEKRSLENNLAAIQASKASTQEELAKQQSHVDEVNLLYNSLRSQITQLTQLLNDKEAELKQKNRELGSLRQEIAGLRVRSEKLQEELAATRDLQKKTIDDLASAVRINALLQNKINTNSYGNESPDIFSKDKQDAEELKRKIEVILEPANNKN
ncbi:MAG: hypothetical protein WDL87_00955 [Candidatus Omnitrophota bacterium]|jgi:chromosome segregation ATPase